jgi:hypothetical protein
VTGLPERFAKLLNGRSGERPAVLWRPDPEDVVAGLILEFGRTSPSRHAPEGRATITIQVEYATMGGREIERCEWVRVLASHAAIAAWISRDNPQVGDAVAIKYVGRSNEGGSSYRHEYICGVEREPGEAPQAEGQKW